MHLRGRRLKFTAVAVLVVLSLTGFSSGRHGHGRKSDGGSGGGCSSSSQNHDSSSSTSGGSRYRDYDDDDDYGDTGSSSGSSSASTSTPLKDARVKLVSCATEDNAYATVKVSNPNSQGAYFTVTVRFVDAGSEQLDAQSVDEFVAANDAATVQVPLENPGLAAQVDHCDPDLYAPAG
ncbi:hypothetical protein ADK57_01960 [Streptomyces sp. MMG1533]|uniref:hypothetical protein n=1 Tax=Streptomyces sp. MMG1533 TaxID=1415546 RepID=UPI0006AF974C|nr:hypothetical protein [Streptomyces sp. MMG1533]KOU77645.1 hypothetical protein ADK57_01960 [Streptomyces sp. MMG1533]